MKEKVKTVKGSFASCDDLQSTHPAFGQISISRINHSGLQKLYGSAVGWHPHTMMLRIKTSERSHHLNHDTYYAKKTLIEVELSASQFADMLTHMNYGDGVPCTIRALEGKLVPEIDDDDPIEVDRIKDEFKNKVMEMSAQLKEDTKSLEDILSKKSINKNDKNIIRNMLNSVSRFFWDQSTFTMDMFGEAAEKITTQSKKEVEAFYRTVVEDMGIKAIAEADGVATPKLKGTTEK
jgi:hypothetical protein